MRESSAYARVSEMTAKRIKKKSPARGPAIALAVLVLLGAGALGVYALVPRGEGVAIGKISGSSRLTLKDIPINGQRAYAYLKEICELGPRPSGSAAMVAQQELLVEHFRPAVLLAELGVLRGFRSVDQHV